MRSTKNSLGRDVNVSLARRESCGRAWRKKKESKCADRRCRRRAKFGRWVGGGGRKEEEEKWMELSMRGAGISAAVGGDVGRRKRFQVCGFCRQQQRWCGNVSHGAQSPFTVGHVHGGLASGTAGQSASEKLGYR
jgi:hypothetical protein